MKTLFKLSLNGIVLLLLLLTNQNVVSAKGNGDGEPYMVKEFKVDGAASANVRTSGGNISVLGQSGSKTVKVEVFVNNRSSKSNEEALKDFDINVSQEGNNIVATAERKSSVSGNWKVSISFRLSVPVETSTTLNTSGGNIELENVAAVQNVRTSGGNLSLKKIKGNLDGETSGGNIDISTFEGKMDVHTSGGSIALNDASGELKLNTSGGNIDLNNISGSVDARTSGGNISANIKKLDKYLTLSTSGGNIDTTIPSGLGMDLDLNGSAVNTKLTNFTGEAKKDRIIGKMNGGGVPVKMSTSGGNVELRYQM